MKIKKFGTTPLHNNHIAVYTPYKVSLSKNKTPLCI